MSTISVGTISSTSGFMDRDTMSPTSFAEVDEDSTITRSPSSSPEIDEDSSSTATNSYNSDARYSSVGENGRMPPYSAWDDIYRWRCTGTDSGKLPNNDSARFSPPSESENGDSRVFAGRRLGRRLKARRPKKIFGYLMSRM